MLSAPEDRSAEPMAGKLQTRPRAVEPAVPASYGRLRSATAPKGGQRATCGPSGCPRGSGARDRFSAAACQVHPRSGEIAIRWGDAETASTTRVLQSGHRLTVCLSDCIDARSVSEIERQLLPQLSSADGRPDVLFDLQAVRSFDLDVRAALVALHRTVAGQTVARCTWPRVPHSWLGAVADSLCQEPRLIRGRTPRRRKPWLTQGKERVTWALQRTEQSTLEQRDLGSHQEADHGAPYR